MKTTYKRIDIPTEKPRAQMQFVSPMANIEPDSGGGYKGGQLMFANEARFTEQFFSVPLTAYAVGWKDPNNIQKSLDFIAPAVQVARRFEWKKATNAEEFYSETDDLRAIGSDFKRVEFKGTTVTDKTINKGLTYVVDLDNVPAGVDWQQPKVDKLLRRLLRNELRRGKSLLSAAATNTAKTWDTTAGKDPDQDVENELSSGADDTGFVPNRIIYGHTAWIKRRLSLRAQTTAGGFANSRLTPDELAAYLGVDGVMISRERYQSSSTAKSQIVSNLVIAFYAEDGVDTEDPSTMKRFVTQFSGDQGNGYHRVYVQQISSKLVAITVEHYSTIVVTSTTGIRQLTIS